ncbi:polymorphic toxin-type HINT domain-containing protein [Streptomyces sp. NPDC086787]|uniref:polymorphic toxin-type HINT domain-containing protein n=1 Tax=Streptomyces sp. NPDC086787 TaxID=3365759 RepID=UPI003826C024
MSNETPAQQFNDYKNAVTISVGLFSILPVAAACVDVPVIAGQCVSAGAAFGNAVNSMFTGANEGVEPPTPGGKVASECSFTPDTQVLLEGKKSKPIQKVKFGDKVEAADPVTGKHKGARAVTATHVNHDYDLIDLRIRRSDDITSTLHTTSNHPFWDDTSHAWVPAGKLKPGHALVTDTNQHVHVSAVIVRPGDRDMYNLTVDDLHTYYVLAGATPVLVHNAGGDPATPNIILRGLQQINDGTLQQRVNPDGTPDFYKGGNNRKTAWWEGAKIYAPDPNNHDYRILEKNGQYKWVGPLGNQKGAGHNYNKLMDIVPRCP